MFDSGPYLNIMVRSLRAKCHILRATLCSKRRPFYDPNVTHLPKLAVSMDTTFFGHLDEGTFLNLFYKLARVICKL